MPSLKKACVICNREFTGETSFCPDDGALLAPLKARIAAGTIIAHRYEILEEIGDGGMGQVYKARDRTLKRFVAIKMLLPALAASSAALLRFQQEAQAVSALNHPHIVGIHDFGVTEACEPFIVFDYIDGISLGALLDEQDYLEEARAVRIFLQICSALSHAHKAAIIHRDLKPRNILLTNVDGDSDYVKVIDFGIAKLLSQDSNSPELTRTGDIFGSAEYMSPEQCRGEKLDARCDVYSVSCVMYRTVTGRLPFAGGDREELLHKHIHESPLKCSQLPAHPPVSQALESVILKGLQKNVADRYQSMSEVKAALLDTPCARQFGQDTSGKTTLLPPSKQKSLPGWKVAAFFLSLVAAILLGHHYLNKKPAPPPIATTTGSIAIKPDQHFDSLMKKAWDYWAKGDYVNTLLNAREAEKRAETLGGEDPRKAKAIYMQGLCDWASGQYHSAGNQLQEALSLTSKGYGTDGLDYAEVETALGVVLSDLGKFTDAERYIRGGMKIRQRLAGPDSQELADSAAALGYMYQKEKKYPQAIKQLTEALYIAQRSGSNPDKDIEYFMVSLADAYRVSKQYSTAELLYKKALALDLGPYKVQAESGLANNYFQRKNYQQAARHAALAEELYDKQLGPVNLKSPEMRKLAEDAQAAGKSTVGH